MILLIAFVTCIYFKFQVDGSSEAEAPSSTSAASAFASSFFGRSEKKSSRSGSSSVMGLSANSEVSVISNDCDSEVSQPGTEEIKGALKVSQFNCSLPRPNVWQLRESEILSRNIAVLKVGPQL